MERFLQVVVATPNISEPAFEALIARLNESLPAEDRRSPKDVHADARRVLIPLGLEFQRYVDNNYGDGEFGYALVSTEPFTQHLASVAASGLHASQIKAMVDLMFASASCRGIADSELPLQRFGAKRAILPFMLSTNRFVRLKSGRYFISTPFSAEIAEYLRTEFLGRTLFACAGCKHWVLRGRLCGGCTFRLHDRCYVPFFEGHALPEGICPECGSQFASGDGSGDGSDGSGGDDGSYS